MKPNPSDPFTATQGDPITENPGSHGSMKCKMIIPNPNGLDLREVSADQCSKKQQDKDAFIRKIRGIISTADFDTIGLHLLRVFNVHHEML